MKHVAGLFIWAVRVWASPDVICQDSALAGPNRDICFPTMWPLYFEARWQMTPPKQKTHTHTPKKKKKERKKKYSCTLTVKFLISQQQSWLGTKQANNLSPKMIYKVLIECQKANLEGGWREKKEREGEKKVVVL